MNSIKIAINNIRRILSEFHSLLFLLVFPLLAGLWAIAMVSFYNVTEVGINYDLPANHPVRSIIDNTGKFKLHYFKEEELVSRIKDKKLDIGILLPENLEQRLIQKQKPIIKVLCEKNNANVIHVRMLMDEYAMSVWLGKEKSGVPYLTNAKNNIAAQRVTMGFLLMFTLLIVGTGMELLLEDKKSKTYMRMFLAPIRTYELILGNILSCIVLGTFQIVFVLLFTEYVFHFDWKVSIFKLFIVLFTFLICAVGINIGLIGFVKNHKIYLITNVGFSLFTCFIGGAFFPSSLMGKNIDKIADFIPQKWAMQCYEKLADGYSFNGIITNLLVLLLFGAVISTFGIKSLYPSEEEL